ncbi:MAG: leucyl aminopeptidase [Microbacteriaceae bacterium]|nr:leucyl aminopeptidase [Microbacteriaceae bacterium]
MTVIIDPKFNPVPSLDNAVDVTVAADAPETGAIAVWVKSEGDLPAGLELSREDLKAAGFTGAKEKTLVLPGAPLRVLVGVGKGVRTGAEARNAAAAFARAASKVSELVIPIGDFADELCSIRAARCAVEGALLARYVYTVLKKEDKSVRVEKITIVHGEKDSAEKIEKGAHRGRVLARANMLARDLGNTPPRHLTAEKFAEVAEKLAADAGLEIEIYDREKAIELGLGGLLGVNAGSALEPRVIKLSYKPENSTGYVGLVGKGIMYDSGGISLKPSNDSHCSMKMDMMGAGAVLSAMTALRDLDVKTAVTGWLMCTDNMPSGTATKLGDVLTMRNGTTVEVRNTDAEGRLVLGDGLALAAETKPDAIVNVATLTGAALMALGAKTTAVFSNNDSVAEQINAASDAMDEVAHRLPLDLRLKEGMKSTVADMTNVGGGPAGGAITAALFLNEFVDGIPWAHLDIAGPMETSKASGWLTAGSTGCAARVLVDFVDKFEQPTGETTGTELD